jgi:hypothetical protein
VLNETACCGAPIVIEYRDGNLYPTAAVIESKLRAGRPTQMVHPCAVSAIMHVSSAYILAGESSRGVVKKEVEPLQREGSGRVAQCEATGNQSIPPGQLAPGRTQELQTERKRSTNPIWQLASVFGELGSWNETTFPIAASTLCAK